MRLNVGLGRAEGQNKKTLKPWFWVALTWGCSKKGQYWCPTGIGDTGCFNYLFCITIYLNISWLGTTDIYYFQPIISVGWESKQDVARSL